MKIIKLTQSYSTTIKFSKDTDVLEAIKYCKEYSIKHNCKVLMQLKEHTKPITSNTDVEELAKSFFNKTFNKYHWANQFNN